LALGHLPLDDRYLWQLAYQVDEAAVTFGKRIYSDEKYTP